MGTVAGLGFGSGDFAQISRIIRTARRASPLPTSQRDVPQDLDGLPLTQHATQPPTSGLLQGALPGGVWVRGLGAVTFPYPPCVRSAALRPVWWVHGSGRDAVLSECG